MKTWKRIPGYLLLLLINGGIGFALYRFIPSFSVELDAGLQATGPLLLIIDFAVLLVFLGIMWLQSRLAKWTGAGGSVALGIICALLAGGAVTVALAANWLTGAYGDPWSGLSYVICVGLAPGFAGYLGAMGK